MKKLFNNILVPVDLFQASDPAIEKAIHIANHFLCNLHIIYIEKAGDGSVTDADKKPELFRNTYIPKLQDGLQLHISKRQGNNEKIIREYAIQHHIDLIILGHTKRRSIFNMGPFLNVNRISRKLECPILTTKNTSGKETIRNIVLPINSHLPVRKIIMASYLAGAFHSRIHLIALSKDMQSGAGHAPYLYKSYQLLKDNLNIAVECHPIEGQNLANTTLEYAQQINADLIVVNPGKELKLRGLINWLFPKFIFNKSLIPVMTIAPMSSK